MFGFYVFLACIGVIIFLFVKLKEKFFNPFITASKLRFLIWDWTKRVILVFFSVSLLTATVKRWYYFHDEIAYSKKSLEVDPSYADQIEIEAYLTDESNLADLFAGKIPLSNLAEPEVEGYREPKPSDFTQYLVIRIKNKGDLPIYGILKDSDSKLCREIDVPLLPPHMNDFKSIVYWKYYTREDRSKSYEKVNLKWKQIYTIKGDK